MKIGILGTGVVGQNIAEKLTQLGHQVMIGTRNKENTLAKTGKDNFGRPPFSEWIKNNPIIKFGIYSEAAAFGEFIVNATNGEGTMQALESAGKKNLANKVMLDISNPLDFSKGMPPTLFISNTDSLGEQIQRTYPEAKVVKGLNTMNAYIMTNPSLLQDDHNVFLNGNNAEAKDEVKKLLTSFGWKEKNIIDMGDISTARGTEQILPIWVRLWSTLQTPMFNFKIVINDQ
ncbi:MAG: NADPH-dependent F420 reductase [Ignavibacteria bacterium]